MMTEQDLPSLPAPQALFGRATGSLCAAAGLVGLMAVVGYGQVLHDRAAARTVANAARHAGEAAHDALVQLADPIPYGTRPRLDAAARALGDQGLVDRAALDAFNALSLDLADQPETRGTLARLLTARVLPALDQRQRAAAAAEARIDARARDFMLLLAGVALVTAAAMAFLVVLPARRGIRAWVALAGEADRENRFRLLHDPVTGMPNATFLHAHLSRLLAGLDRETTQIAVLRLDIDKFGMLRETLGARTSDEILRLIARRLRNTLRAGDLAAHIGHDDFVLVATGLTDASAAAGIAARTQEALSRPFVIKGGTQRVAANIGVTLVSDDEPTLERLLANAEIALAAAEAANGSNSIRYFRDELRVEVERRETLYTELLGGLGHGELVPYFQPQICLSSGALVGFEALVRWNHPRRGLLAPGAFLDFAEQADLTERIGEAVLGQSVRALRGGVRAGVEVRRVGVNFAAKQLRDPALIETIKWEVERADIDPARLAIEVLETVMIKGDADMVARNLRGLASAGFHIELDDFGTGHASIANLRRLMVNRIKIDRGFIDGIESSPEQRELTASMIAMAGALGIHTLAEGVETPEALATLRELGCDLAQGYLIAKPMAVGDTFDWLRTYPARAGATIARPGQAMADPNTP